MECRERFKAKMSQWSYSLVVIFGQLGGMAKDHIGCGYEVTAVGQ